MPTINFDLSAISTDSAAGGEYAQLPEGKYEARVTNTESRVSKNGNEYVTVEFTIVGPSHANYKVWDNHFIYSEKEFPRTRFKWMVEACGLSSIKATEELHGRTCTINVIHAGDQGQYVNVDSYELNTSGPQPAAASGAPKPWAA